MPYTHLVRVKWYSRLDTGIAESPSATQWTPLEVKQRGNNENEGEWVYLHF